MAPLCRHVDEPGGCRHGAACRSSSTPGGPPGHPPASSVSSHRGGFQRGGYQHGSLQRGGFQGSNWTRGGFHSGARGRPQGGRCNDFWNTGECQWGMACTRSHVPNPARQGPSTSGVPATASPVQAATVDAAAAIVPTTDGLFALSRYPTPAEAHTQLRKMGAEGVRVESAQQIYAFVGALFGANKANGSWTETDRNLFRQELAKTDPTNLLLRLGEIVSFPAAVDAAPTSRTTMSFERGLMPLIAYLTFDCVLKSPVKKEVNALYSVLLNNFDDFAATVNVSLDAYLARGSAKSDAPATTLFAVSGPTPLRHHSLYQVFKPLASLLDECFGRWRGAVVQAPQLPSLVDKLDMTFRFWSGAITASPPTFIDSLTSDPELCRFVVRRLADDIRKVVARATRTTLVLNAPGEDVHSTSTQPARIHQGALAHLAMTFQGPSGVDNNLALIKDIAIAPTAEELIGGVDKVYLPANLFGAPHHLPDASPIERHLDVQFRLLREEALAGLRQSVHLILEDLAVRPIAQTDLGRLLKTSGGVYRREGSFFGVFTGARFVDFSTGHSGFEVSLKIDVPAAAGRRKDFWESKSGLSAGNLVALVWNDGGQHTASSGVVVSNARQIIGSQGRGLTVRVKITFFDRAIAVRVPQLLQQTGDSQTANDGGILIRSDTLFPVLDAYLRALQVADPVNFPFGDLLAPGPKTGVVLEPPAHAQVPGWRWNLSSLLKEPRDATFSATDPESIIAAREILKAESRLDPSQADAMVDIMTRSIALLQGPPGTGKSFTGVELIRVLLANKCGPILLIAYTNQALDHLLRSVFDGHVTKRIVRLGGRSADEVVSNLSLESLEMTDQSSLLGGNSRIVRQAHGRLKQLQREMNELSALMQHRSVDSEFLDYFLERWYIRHCESLLNPPLWVREVANSFGGDDGGQWTRVHHKSSRPAVHVGFSDLWLDGDDLAVIDELTNPAPPTPPAASTTSALPVSSASGNNAFGLLSAEVAIDSDDEYDAASELSDAPSSSASSLSAWESWSGEVTEPDVVTPMLEEQPAERPAEQPAKQPAAGPQPPLASEASFIAAFGPLPVYQTQQRSLAQLQTADLWAMSLAERRELFRFWIAEAQNERAKELATVFTRLIGDHETAQAEFQDLRGVSPRIMLVEEAGQTLEPHILANLTKTIEHLVLIGDPLQLRPSINNYALSVENERSGSFLYRFDVSLLERLVQEGLPMSQLQVQRRMTPEVSSLIRAPLYPRLQDNEVVLERAPVKGFAQNVFFLDHEHGEGGSADDVSRHNAYEVKMIVDMVGYLLRQGKYNHERGIVVLCAYLGQLIKVRQALQGRATVVIDQRDQDKLDLAGDEQLVVSAHEVPVSQQVTLRTIDNFQGCEGDVIILSTVRNVGGADGPQSKGTIGFLKSVNRANVALSRAREGLYILGSASLLSAHSPFWREVIELLHERGQVGPALPIQCSTHKDEVRLVDAPGQLPLISPSGGYLRACDARLDCGHTCPSSCHADDPDHIATRCDEACLRVLSCGHPCASLCSAACPPCRFPVKNVELPCGHIAAVLPCDLAQTPDRTLCKEFVARELVCGHSINFPCHEDPSAARCLSTCGIQLECCGKACPAKCWQCRPKAPSITAAAGPHIKHLPHLCDRQLAFCPHRCSGTCSVEHECGACKAPKVAVFCGETSCPAICLAHSKADVLDQPADLLGGLLVRDLLAAERPRSIDSMLLQLPCRHVLTVETLDGLVALSDFYERDENGAWLAPATPPTGFTKLPVCPSCRTPFFCRRFGRPIRKAALDVLEQNLVFQSSTQLQKLTETLARVEKADRVKEVQQLAAEVFTAGSLTEKNDFDHFRKRVVQDPLTKAARADQPAPIFVIFGPKAERQLGERPLQAFKKMAAPLSAAYKRALEIAQQKSAHLTMWESALTSRHKVLLAQGLEPEVALTKATQAMRLPPPRAKTRFFAETLIFSINIRNDIATVLQTFVDRLQLRSQLHHRWHLVLKWILTSVLEDAELIHRVAGKHGLLRYQLLSTVIVFRAKLAVFRCNAAAEIAFTPALSIDQRKMLADKSENWCQAAWQAFGASFLSEPVMGLDGLDGAEWLEEKCQVPAEQIMADWAELTYMLRSGGFFQAVTAAEKQAVVQALQLGRGSWYQCPLGHPFAIGECGQAMEMSRCPECGATIGGAHRVLVAGNSSSNEMNALV